MEIALTLMRILPLMFVSDNEGHDLEYADDFEPLSEDQD